MIDIVKPMAAELREFQEKTGMCISECYRFFMNVYYVLDIMNKSQEVSGENLEEKPYEKWLKKFQREHDNLKHIGEKEIRDLAAALHDDIPFGYEASMRLSDWLLHIDFDFEVENINDKQNGWFVCSYCHSSWEETWPFKYCPCCKGKIKR